MIFNSLSFAVFLPIVFLIYWFIAKKNLKFQNFLLLCASYFFYSCWDWRFLFLLIFSTLLDYFTGIKMYESNSTKNKRIWFWISIIVNLGFLGVFKYYNFFITSFTEFLIPFGLNFTPLLLKIILPVGISFYTFHGLSYVIDIYKDRIKPERNFIDYSLFVSFFPLLVAGPIERATHLLPQIKNERIFNYSKSVDGLRQIIWGLFKKIVIADQCAVYANISFTNSDAYLSGSTLFIGAIFFSIQIYCDFSGYSDIALGVARLFGFELLKNFSFPYFSRNIAEFWRRWHISLSTWFRDYLYIPLGGSKGSVWKKIRNTFIIFIVSGFWHGANWTFIIWGFFNALFILPSIIFNTNRNNLDTVAQGRNFPNFKEFSSIGITFLLTVFAWIFFRSENVTHAFEILNEIFSNSFFSFPQIKLNLLFFIQICLIFFLFIVEWFGRSEEFGFAKTVLKLPNILRYGFYWFLIISIIIFNSKSENYIYFQF